MSAAAIAAVKRMQGALRKLSAVPSQAASEAAAAIKDLWHQSTASGTDPYGNAWEPHAESTVARWGAHDLLDLSGDMISGLDVTPAQGAGIVASFSSPYPAAFHQVGTKNMPARKVLPDTGIPDTWERAIADALESAFERTMAEAR